MTRGHDQTRDFPSMMCALYGDFTPHPWLADGAPSALFEAHSLSSGWGVPRGSAPHGGPLGPRCWALFDETAEAEIATDELIAGFHVVIDDVSSGPLLAAPFVRCCVDTVRRRGGVRLRAVQVLVPVAEGSPPTDLTAWFAAADPSAKVLARLGISCGTAGMEESVTGMFALLRSEVRDVAEIPCAPMVTQPTPAWYSPIHEEYWPGPAVVEVSTPMTLCEWTPEVVGWLTGRISHTASRAGMRTPLLVTVCLTDV